MTSDATRWTRVQELFAAALDKAPASRAGFLAEACPDDAALRTEVETLLAANDQPGRFLDTAPKSPMTARRLEPGTRLGRYEIVELLGAGGMGEVYRARDAGLGRDVAIKVLATGAQGSSAMRRFEFEARATGALDHSNILQVHDIGIHEGNPYIVSEVLQGHTLREELGGKSLPAIKALDYALQIAHGLSAAHEKGIVHRDLKPENLFVTTDGRLKILDFGIAKLIPEGGSAAPAAAEVKTQTGALVGTMSYMSPEQLRGAPPDRRSDIFSFGAILYEMLSGERAFGRESALESAHAIVHEEPSPLPPQVPDDLQRIVRGCLKKDPSQRFQSAKDVALRLSAAVPAPRNGETGATLWTELKRRRVVRALVGYGIAAFAVLQIIEPVMHALHWPDQILSYVVVALAVGFPVVLGLSWIFDVKADREEGAAPGKGTVKGARVAPLLVGIGALAAAPGLLWYFVFRAPPGSTAQVSQAALTAKPSIAVLAFADMSPGKDQEYFSDGIAEEILNALAHVDGLRVIGRTSSFSFKGKNADLRTIGHELNVDTILEGSVRKAGDRIRISSQLINAADGAHLWSETYERSLANVFAVQDEIARAVVSALRVQLLPAQAPSANAHRPANPEAYGRYLLGNHFLNQYSSGSLQQAAKAYQESVSFDPDYAPAWAGLARTLVALISIGNNKFDATTAQRALEAAEKAVAKDPSLSEGYAARGRVRLRAWDWDGAKADLERALSLNAGNSDAQQAMGILYYDRGWTAESLASAKRATELDPLSSQAWNGLGANYQYLVGDFELARKAYNRALEISPEHAWAAGNLLFVDVLQGRFAAVVARSAQSDPERRLRLLAAVSMAEHGLGHAQRSQEALDEMVAHPDLYSPYDIAAIYAFRGERDRAFEWLERAYAERTRQLHLIKVDTFFGKLHGDPRFNAFLAKMKLPIDGGRPP